MVTTTGSRVVQQPVETVRDRLRLLMAAGNFEVQRSDENHLLFKHGAYFTESAPMFAKRGEIVLFPSGGTTRIEFRVSLRGWPKYYFILFGTLLCWLILPAFGAYRALIYHPRMLMENLIDGV